MHLIILFYPIFEALLLHYFICCCLLCFYLLLSSCIVLICEVFWVACLKGDLELSWVVFYPNVLICSCCICFIAAAAKFNHIYHQLYSYYSLLSHCIWLSLCLTLSPQVSSDPSRSSQSPALSRRCFWSPPLLQPLPAWYNCSHTTHTTNSVTLYAFTFVLATKNSHT